jgi:nicotinamide-nucleotide amidase
MDIFPQPLIALAADLISQARAKRLRIVTAESCTGGLVSGCLTTIPGASEVFDRGFVTYADDAKMAQLSVDRKTLGDFGAVSPETAFEMAEGALLASHADIAVSVTGISGPSGGTPDKPVGTVFIAVTNSHNRDSHILLRNNFAGGRDDIRLASVEAALKALREVVANL